MPWQDPCAAGQIGHENAVCVEQQILTSLHVAKGTFANNFAVSHTVDTVDLVSNTKLLQMFRVPRRSIYR